MYIIFVQSAALTILLLNVNHVANPFVGHGHSGHHGRPVQTHVVMEKDHMTENLLGTMIQHSLKLKPKAAKQVKSEYSSSNILYKYLRSLSALGCMEAMGSMFGTMLRRRSG